MTGVHSNRHWFTHSELGMNLVLLCLVHLLSLSPLFVIVILNIELLDLVEYVLASIYIVKLISNVALFK